MNNRRKGLAYVHEVKNILQKKGFIVEGPMFRPLFIRGKRSVVHADFFGCFDLVSYGLHVGGTRVGYQFHQVSIDKEKSRKAKKMIEAGLPGFIWGRSIQDNKIIYNVYEVQWDELKLVNAIYLSDYKDKQPCQ